MSSAMQCLHRESKALIGMTIFAGTQLEWRHFSTAVVERHQHLPVFAAWRSTQQGLHSTSSITSLEYLSPAVFSHQGMVSVFMAPPRAVLLPIICCPLQDDL